MLKEISNISSEADVSAYQLPIPFNPNGKELIVNDGPF